MGYAFQKEYPQVVRWTGGISQKGRKHLGNIITIDQVDNEEPKAGHSQWKLIYLKSL